MSVVLTHEPGQPWYVYKGLSADPVPGGHAVIDSLALPGSVSYSLSHRPGRECLLHQSWRDLRIPRDAGGRIMDRAVQRQPRRSAGVGAVHIAMEIGSAALRDQHPPERISGIAAFRRFRLNVALIACPLAESAAKVACRWLARPFTVLGPERAIAAPPPSTNIR